MQPRRLPSIAALLAFEAAASTKSFTKAGQRLALTQSAVSKQVQALEQHVGRRLFERRGKAISLTLAGEQLMRQLPAWLSTGERLLGRPARGAVGGPLKLALLPTFGTQWLAPRIADFLQQYPRIELTLESRLLPFDFHVTDFDAAIHYGASDWPGAELQRLFGEVTIAVAAPAVAAAIKKPRDAWKQRWVLQTTRAQAVADFQAFLKTPAPPDAPALPPLHVEQFATLVRIVRGGVGIGLVPERWVADELARGELVALLGYATEEAAAYHVATPTGRTTSPACAAFVRWLVEQTS